MKRSWTLLAVVAGVVLVLDRWTKQWAEATLAGRAPIDVIGEVVRLTYTRNSGVAFGLGAGLGFPFYLFSIAAAIVIIVLFARQPVQSPWRQLSLALILGGALGNLWDRLTSGEVVDFIEIGWDRWHWPVFNVADSAVTVGVVIFGLTWSHRHDEAAVSKTSAPDAAPIEADDEPDLRARGAAAEQRRAAGSLPGGGPEGPLA